MSSQKKSKRSNAKDASVSSQNNYEILKQEMIRYGLVYLSTDVIEDLDDLVGLDEEKRFMKDFFEALIGFNNIREKLTKAKLTPNLSMLLYGPPGTGKTSLTLAFCKFYNIPACVIQSDKLVSSMLGDTVKNIRGVFETAEKWAEKLGLFLLFFDELDSITSERSNVHEVGELKRAVVSFLQIVDQINAKALPLAIVGATNHEKRLDSAVWRRFTYHLEFKFPSPDVRFDMINKFILRLQAAEIDVSNQLLQILERDKQLIIQLKNRYEIRNIMGEEEKLAFIISPKFKKEESFIFSTIGYTGADISRAFRIAFLKIFKNGKLEFEDLYDSIKLVGGTKEHVEQQKKLSHNGINNNRETNHEKKLTYEDEKSLKVKSDENDLFPTFE